MSDFKKKMKERYSEDFDDIIFRDGEKVALIMRLYVNDENIKVSKLPGDSVKDINFEENWIDVEFW